MAQDNLDSIQSRIAAVVDQDETTSNISSTDYSLRLSYINQSLREWQDATDWQALYGEYNSLISTSTGNASVVLPIDFRKLASFPLITWDGANTDAFPETRGQDENLYTSTDKRVDILGNPNSRYVMRVYGVTLVSGASVKVPYYKSVGSLVSPANIPEIPESEYLVRRTIAHIWEAREDARFPQAKQEAERILANLIDRENVFSEASTYSRVRTVEETKYGDFRWGK